MALGEGSAATVFVDVEGDLSKFRKDVAGAGDVAKKELGSGKMAAAGKIAGASIVGGITVALGAGLSRAMESEQIELNLAASLGLDAASEEARTLAETSTSLYRDAWGETLEDTSAAVGDAYANFGEFASTDEIERWSAQSIAIADTFGLDVSEIMSTAGTAFYSGLTDDDPQEIFDAIVASAQRVPEGLRGEILAAGTEYSQFFADLGFGSEEAFGILVANAGDGAYGIDKAGDAIKEFTIRATDGSASSVEAFEALGLDADIMAERILSGGADARDAFANIVEGLLETEDPAARAQAAIALFGTPIEDLGVNDIPTFLEGLVSAETALGDVEGAAQEVADTVGGSAQASFESLKRKGLGILADFAADVLLPALEDLLPVLDGFVTVIGALPAPVKSAAVAGGLLGGSLLFLAGPIAKAASLVKGFFALMTANPYVLLIAATVALVVVIVKNWDEISAFLSEAWEGIKAGISDAWNWIKSTSETVWNAISDFFAQYWPYLLGIFTGGIGLVVGLIVQNWDSIRSKTVEVWDAISGKIGDVASAVEGFIRDKIVAPVETLIGFFADLPGKAQAAWDGLRNAISNVVGSIKSELGEIAAAADRALGPLDEIVSFGGGALGSVLGAIPGIPEYDSGGVVPGPTGAPRLVLAHGGETFIPTHKRGMEGAAGSGGGTLVVNLHDATIRSEDDVVRLARMLEEETRRVRRSRGGI